MVNYVEMGLVVVLGGVGLMYFLEFFVVFYVKDGWFCLVFMEWFLLEEGFYIYYLSCW